MRFVEVESDSNSTPRDRLLARRTWWHREIVNYSDWSIRQTENNQHFSEEVTKTIDEAVKRLNVLRLENSLNIQDIQTILDEIKEALK